MAEHLYMVVKDNSINPDETIIDGIYVALVNADDASTDAEIIADAEGQIQTTHDIPDDYFTTVIDISDLTAGPLKDDLDTMVFLPRTAETIEGP